MNASKKNRRKLKDRQNAVVEQSLKSESIEPHALRLSLPAGMPDRYNKYSLTVTQHIDQQVNHVVLMSNN